MKSKKVKESKEKIYSLAILATKSIYENKFLLEEISFCENQLKLIKDIFSNCSNFEGDKSKLKNYIATQINNIHNLLKTSKLKLEENDKKLKEKSDLSLDKIFDGSMSIKNELKDIRTDNFLLAYQINQKDYQISRLKKMIKDIENSYYSLSNLRNQIKEIKVTDNVGYYYIDDNLDFLSKKLNRELLYYNFNNTKFIKLKSKKNNLLNKKKLFIKSIKFFEGKNIKESKIFKEEEDKISSEKNDKINKDKNTKKKIELLTVSQLFNVNNEEGKAEAIIDHELHSDDEIVFETKIKQPKKLTKNENLKKIKEIIPKVDLSMIEYNKKKVMNDADLYSFQNRKLLAEDIETQIKEMKTKKKMNQHILRKNKKKIKALENFINKLKNDISLLKKMKLKISAREEFFSQKGSQNEISKNIKELNEIEVIKEDENDLEDNESNNVSIESVASYEEYVTYTQRSASSNKNNKLNIKNSKKNGFVKQEHQIKTKRKNKRSNSK